ncbi:N-acetylmuramoyl-L-alanine amidase [Rapidithrix thailandica]|uniref:N-acetylmuramoyl-L-alanine amidase n=1 Tax=Rapidithrix thailandica TaxID=413964 RepID=A0AAW9S0F7_9BACT
MRKNALTIILLVCWLVSYPGHSWAHFAADPDRKKVVKVVIDPGHGGQDPGKVRGSDNLLHEKDINLAIALKLGHYLEKNIKNIKIYYTRKSDIYRSLEKRVDMANKVNADYFISIHCNSNPNRGIYGTKTHIHSHRLERSKVLAQQIEHEFASRGGRKSRGIMSAYDRGYNLYVLQHAKMPGVLVETGFLTNPNEEKYLNSKQGQVYTASAIYRAFKEYLKGKYTLDASEFKIQIMATAKPVSTQSNVFQSLKHKVERVMVTEKVCRYKYMVGKCTEYSDAIKILNEVKKAGFKDAFIVKTR